MDAKSKRQKRQENTLSLLNVTIEALNLAKEVSSATPAKAVFGSVSAILSMIRVCSPPSPIIYPRFTYNQDSMANETDYVDLGLACANVCKALERGMNGKKSEDFSEPVREAMNQLTTWVKSAIYCVDGSLTLLLIAELWRRSGGTSPNRADGTRSPDLSMRGTTKKQS